MGMISTQLWNIEYRRRPDLLTLLRTCSSPERVYATQGQYRQSSAIYMRDYQACSSREALVGVAHLCAQKLGADWWLGRVAFLLTASTVSSVFSPHFEWKRNMLSLKLEISMSHAVDPGLYPNCQD